MSISDWLRANNAIKTGWHTSIDSWTRSSPYLPCYYHTDWRWNVLALLVLKNRKWRPVCLYLYQWLPVVEMLKIKNKHLKKNFKQKYFVAAKWRSFHKEVPKNTHQQTKPSVCASRPVNRPHSGRAPRGNVQICTNTRWQLWITADRHVYLWVHAPRTNLDLLTDSPLF